MFYKFFLCAYKERKSNCIYEFNIFGSFTLSLFNKYLKKSVRLKPNKYTFKVSKFMIGMLLSLNIFPQCLKTTVPSDAKII